MNHRKKIGLILKTSFVMPVMTIFSSLWCLMLIKLVTGSSFLNLLTWKNLCAILLTLNLLWVLRLIDEIKDFEYDKTAHPERALPSGLVNPKDIYLYIFIFSLLGVIGSLLFHSLLVIFYPVTILYGLFLIRLENVSKILKENFLVNLIITYPVNTLINLSLISFYSSDTHQLLQASRFILIPFFAFLHYEFARKTMKSSVETRGQELYSEQIGFFSSLFLSLAVALSAVISHYRATELSYYHFFFFVWPLIFAVLFAFDLIKPKLYKTSAMVFILLFYLIIVVT